MRTPTLQREESEILYVDGDEICKKKKNVTKAKNPIISSLVISMYISISIMISWRTLLFDSLNSFLLMEVSAFSHPPPPLHLLHNGFYTSPHNPKSRYNYCSFTAMSMSTIVLFEDLKIRKPWGRFNRNFVQ